MLWIYIWVNAHHEFKGVNSYMNSYTCKVWLLPTELRRVIEVVRHLLLTTWFQLVWIQNFKIFKFFCFSMLDCTLICFTGRNDSEVSGLNLNSFESDSAESDCQTSSLVMWLTDPSRTIGRAQTRMCPKTGVTWMILSRYISEFVQSESPWQNSESLAGSLADLY